MTKSITVLPLKTINKFPLKLLLFLTQKSAVLLPCNYKLSGIISIILLFIASTILIPPVHSHSGGTDANGCHTNSKTGDYHCHTPKSGKRSSSSSRRSSPSSRSSSSYSPRIPPQSLQEISGLSEEKFSSNPECKKFTFSEMISQAEQGEVNLRCGQTLIYIRAH